MDIDDNLKQAIEKVLADKRIADGDRDPRPTDRDVFFAILPGILGGYAGKQGDSRSAIASALQMAREAVGQCCMMAIARDVTVCSDGSHLAIRSHQLSVPGVQGALPPGQDPTQRGVMVQQYPNTPNQQNGGVVAHNQPGGGGMVQQFPTASAGYQGSAPPQQQGAGGLVAQYPTVQPGMAGGYQPGAGPRPGQTSNIQPVAMIPNDPMVHPYATPTGPVAPPQMAPPQYQPQPPPGYR